MSTPMAIIDLGDFQELVQVPDGAVVCDPTSFELGVKALRDRFSAAMSAGELSYVRK